MYKKILSVLSIAPYSNVFVFVVCSLYDLKIVTSQFVLSLLRFFSLFLSSSHTIIHSHYHVRMNDWMRGKWMESRISCILAFIPNKSVPRSFFFLLNFFIFRFILIIETKGIQISNLPHGKILSKPWNVCRLWVENFIFFSFSHLLSPKKSDSETLISVEKKHAAYVWMKIRQNYNVFFFFFCQQLRVFYCWSLSKQLLHFVSYPISVRSFTNMWAA